MEHIYRELEKSTSSARIHKFTVFVEDDMKEVYEREYLIAKINYEEKLFYTEYKLMGDVILFSRYLRNLGYKQVKFVEELRPKLVNSFKETSSTMANSF